MPLHLCQLCPKSFESGRQLAAHEEEHRGKCPYRCPGCPAAFGRRKELHKHIRGEHKDERIYACHLCPFTFKECAHLTAHLKVHTRGFLYRCHLCGEGFGLRYMLSNHLNRKHVAKPRRKKRTRRAT
ncbi:zinc finger protein 131-like [Haemaphysalis longicornis]